MNTEAIPAQIDIEDPSLHKQFFKSSITGKENKSYYWVQLVIDKGTKKITLENIYDITKDKFVLVCWVNSAGHGLMNGDYVNLTNYVLDENYKIVEFLHNKVNVKDGKMYYPCWLNSKQWLQQLQKRDIIA